VISSAGGISAGEKITLEWTLGESAISTVRHEKGMLTEGYHQPLLQLVNVNADEIPSLEYTETLQSHGLQLRAIPNPVMSVLQVTIESSLVDEGRLQLLSANGKLLSEWATLLQQSSMDLAMDTYAAGTYFLILRDEDGRILESRKIIKSR
jgi:hypothetical protein